MNVTVIGFGHFAGVVAQALAKRRHAVWQLDETPALIRSGQRRAEDEPGYTPYVPDGSAPEIIWIAYDCPLDTKGFPLTGEIEARIHRLHERTPLGVPFIISCQWPVGTMRQVAALCEDRELIYVMENVRVGKAVTDFESNPLPAIGLDEFVSPVAERFLGSIDGPRPTVAWESAELAKHTTNAFMALQIAFINEIAHLAGRVGANPNEVADIVRDDFRVNDNAPLNPGGPFGGGSLLRDLLVLEGLTDAPIIHAIRKSNDSRS